MSVLYHFNQNQHRFPEQSFSLQESTAVTFSDTESAKAPASTLNLQPELPKQRLWGALYIHSTSTPDTAASLKHAQSNTENISLMSGAVSTWGKTCRESQDLLVMAWCLFLKTSITHVFPSSKLQQSSKCWDLKFSAQTLLDSSFPQRSQSSGFGLQSSLTCLWNSSHTPTPSQESAHTTPLCYNSQLQITSQLKKSHCKTVLPTVSTSLPK